MVETNVFETIKPHPDKMAFSCFVDLRHGHEMLLY